MALVTMATASTAVLVAGHIPKWLPLVRNLAGCAIPIGAGLLMVNEVLGSVVIVCAVLLLVAFQIMISLRRRGQRWITDTGQGFVVEDREGRREYDDEDIYSLDMETRSIYSQGVMQGVRRVFRVKVQEEPREIEMRNLIKPGQVDELGRFIQRCIQQYRERAEEALAAGASVAGKNWSLSSSGLTAEGRSPLHLQLEEIGSVGEFDGQVCVWKRGEHEACFRVPVRSKNAFLLQLLLANRVNQHAEAAGAEHDSEGLGRILFQRKGQTIVLVVLWGLALALAGVSIVAIIGGAQGGDGFVVLTGLLLLILVGLCGWGIVAQRRSLFRCHERGVYSRGAFSENELRYEEVDEFTYSATRQYYNGVYIGTALNIVFKSLRGEKPKTIKFGRSVKNADDELQELSNHVSQVLGSRMLRQVAAGERVKWTDNLTFVPDGIEYRPSGLVGRKEAVLLPFSQVGGFNIDQGTFHLWEAGKTKAVMKEQANAKNFFPGFFALQAMYTAAEETASA